jgi:hypothetical protein
MSEQSQNQNQRRSSYTTVAQFYDRQHSSIKFGYVNHDVFIEIAAIFDEMIGKEATKGQKVYDYDNRLFATIRGTELPLFIAQVNALAAGEIDEFAIETSARSLSFCAGGVYEGIDGFTITVGEKDKEGNELRSIIFAFPAAEEKVVGFVYPDTEDGETEEKTITLAVEWDWFVKWVNEGTLLNSFAHAEQGARIGAPAGGAAGAGKRPAQPSNTPARAKAKRPGSANRADRPVTSQTTDAGSAVDSVLGDGGADADGKVDFDDDLPM